MCTVCGGCLMHHGGPICEDGCWLRHEIVGRTCTLCDAERGLLLDLDQPRMTFEQGQHLGLFRPHRWRTFLEYCRWLQMPEINIVPIQVSGAYVAAQLVIGATEEELQVALGEIADIHAGERKNREFRSRSANN